jgi:hypothetical protein
MSVNLIKPNFRFSFSSFSKASTDDAKLKEIITAKVESVLRPFFSNSISVFLMMELSLTKFLAKKNAD